MRHRLAWTAPPPPSLSLVTAHSLTTAPADSVANRTPLGACTDANLYAPYPRRLIVARSKTLMKFCGLGVLRKDGDGARCPSLTNPY